MKEMRTLSRRHIQNTRTDTTVGRTRNDILARGVKTTTQDLCLKEPQNTVPPSARRSKHDVVVTARRTLCEPLKLMIGASNALVRLIERTRPCSFSPAEEMMICCWSEDEGDVPRARLMSAPPGGGGGDPGRFDMCVSGQKCKSSGMLHAARTQIGLLGRDGREQWTCGGSHGQANLAQTYMGV